jgi:Fe-S-cluster containining protein
MFVQSAAGGGVMNVPPREEVPVDVRTRFGRVQAKVALPPKMRLAELAWNALVLDERLIAMATRADALLGNVIACSKGCGACCRQPVPLSAPEAWMLADLVRSFPVERQTILLSRFADARLALKAARFDERSLPAGASKEQVAAVALDYFDLGIPCPFLEDESCSIHPNRPSICREYLVTTPAILCANPRAPRQRAVPVPARLSECLAILSAEVLGNDVEVIPHVRALDWAAAHAEDGKRQFETRPMFERLMELVNAVAARPAESR